MMTKEQEDYIFKLKAELMFRGKDEDEVHAIGDELKITLKWQKRMVMMLVYFKHQLKIMPTTFLKK